MIETRELSKNYGRTWALDGLNLQIGAGELFGFIGPNGAGKTTTIQILATLLVPSSGEARVDGLDVRRAGLAVRRIIGYMPDFFGLYEGLRVWEYLDFFAAAYEVPAGKRQRIIGDVLELTDLVGKRDAMVEALSRGMQQRLGLARVLIHDPKVLLLDEPASGLDPRARVELREILKELKTMGKTVLISSHILSELAEVCTSVGILSRGRLVVSGSVEDILAQAGAGRVIRVEVEGPAADAVRALRNAEIEGVEGVEGVADSSDSADSADSADSSDSADSADVNQAAGERNGEGSELRVRLNGSSGPPEIAAFLVTRGFRLRHLESESVDLEEAYLRLTGGDEP